ncbi:MAG: flippase-like domain-containing protein [Acidobacteria bacterium]|nr:flippase-like domain-containing protein [Acidobacteriota bacterium]
MTDFAIHTIDSAPAAAKQTLGEILRKYEFIPNLAAELAAVPPALKAYATLGTLLTQTSLSPVEQQIVIAATSVSNGCEYCVAAASAELRAAGLPADQIEALRTGRPLSDAKLETLRVFTSAIVDRRGRLTPSEFQRFLDAGFRREQVFEVLVGVAMKTLSNYANHIAGHVGSAFLIVTGLYGLDLAVRAAALWRALPSRSLPFREVLRVQLSGEVAEMLTSTGPFLAEPLKGWLLKRDGISGAEAFGTVAIEYLLYTIVASWMTAVALSVLVARNVLPDATQPLVFGIIAAVVALTVAFLFAAVTGIGLIVPILRGAAGVIGDRASSAAKRFEPVERVLVAFLHDRPTRLLEVLLIEAGGHALLALEILVVTRALGHQIAAADPFIIEGAVKVIKAGFFFVPGQLGVSEGAYIFLFRAIGLPAAAGVTMALVRRIRALLVAGLGMAILRLCP